MTDLFFPLSIGEPAANFGSSLIPDLFFIFFSVRFISNTVHKIKSLFFAVFKETSVLKLSEATTDKERNNEKTRNHV